MQWVGRGKGVGVALDLRAALRQRARPPDERGPRRRGLIAAGVRRRPVIANHLALVLAPAKEIGNNFLPSAVAPSIQSWLDLPESHFLADIEVEEVGGDFDVRAVGLDGDVGADCVVRWHWDAPSGGVKSDVYFIWLELDQNRLNGTIEKLSTHVGQLMATDCLKLALFWQGVRKNPSLVPGTTCCVKENRGGGKYSSKFS